MWPFLFKQHSMSRLLMLVLVLGTQNVATVQAQEENTSNTTGTSAQAQVPSEYFGGTDHDTYLTWYESVESKYAGSAFIYDSSSKNSTENTITNSASDGVAVHWYVDESYVYIGVATRAQDGWVAFGLAEAGGMKGADIVIYETSKPNTLSDAHVLKDRFPLLDICQDWVFLDAINADGFLIFEGKRLLNTNDGQDHPIIDDTQTFIPAQRVIAAWGNDTSTMMYHGPTNRVRGAIRLYGTVDESTKFQSLIAEADGYFDMLVNNYTLENITTAYIDFCFNWDTDVLPQGIPSNTNIYVLAAETILDSNGGGSFVHHAAITASRTPLLNESRACMDFSNYDFFLYSWTPGTFPLVFPSDVGITLGPNDGAIQSFRLQVHYDNPLLLNGITDSSGLRVHYKMAKPVYEAGILPMADILNSLQGTPLNSGTSRFDFSCSGECSTLVLGQDPVTVIGEFFHMHNRGAAAVQYQIRDNQVIRQANVNFFDFEQAGVYAVRQQPYQIFSGDSFSTSFFFESEEEAVFGEASEDEMCNSVLLYYPAKQLLGVAPWICIYDLAIGACNASLATSAVEVTDSGSVATSRLSNAATSFSTSDAYLERTFGYNTNGQCSEKNQSNGDEEKSMSLASTRIAGASPPQLLFFCTLTLLFWLN